MLVVVSFNLNFIKNNVDNVYNVISHKFSWLFILANIAAFIFSLWIIFGRYSNVKLGGEKATPEYSKFSWIAMMFIVTILCFIFMATTVDSSSFVAAESTYLHKDSKDLAPRWLRLFWAVIACIITFVLLQVGGFDAVQVLAILVGFPLAITMFVVIISSIKMLKREMKKS